MRDESNLRILVVLDTYPGLSETFLYTTLCNWIEQKNFSVILAARKRGKAPHRLDRLGNVVYLPSETLPYLVKFLIMSGMWLLLSIRSFQMAKKVFLFLRKNSKGMRNFCQEAYRTLPLLLINADLIYFSFGGLAVKYLTFIKIIPNVVFSLRGSDINIEPLINDTYNKRLSDAIIHARAIHCVCEDIQKKAEALVGRKIPNTKVIYTAINPMFRDLMTNRELKSDHNIQIISVGRLDWRKGLEHGMMAIHHLKAKGIPVKWIIVGAGEYEIPLRWAIRDMGLSDTVVHTGGKNQAEVKTILSQSDIFFHPSVHEGISNAVLEAMAVGLPVVTTTVGGMHEALVDGRHVLFVKPRDWMEMANKLGQLIDSPDLRRELGQCGRSHVLDFFSVEKQQREFLSLFQSALKGDPG